MKLEFGISWDILGVNGIFIHCQEFDSAQPRRNQISANTPEIIG